MAWTSTWIWMFMIAFGSSKGLEWVMFAGSCVHNLQPLFSSAEYMS